jgi:hypothetical protein
MVCFVKVRSVDCIVCWIFHRFNLEWKTHTLQLLHKRLDITPRNGRTSDLRDGITRQPGLSDVPRNLHNVH